MNIFISQSGDKSKKIAEVFKEWIENYFVDVNIFVSSETIDGGEGWFKEVINSLRESDFAISILTKENHSKPWINYEYGALVEILKNKGIDKANVVPILFGITAKEISGEPIQQYQCISFEDVKLKEKLKKMFFNINSLNGNKLNSKDFAEKFEETYEKYKEKMEPSVKWYSPKGLSGFDNMIKLLDEENARNPKRSKLDDYSSLTNPKLYN